ncbi:MAG: 6-phosphogluconolactonase [Planctomycetaceae bacterium]|nr:6-phosphogluconolactonase [Planctomycetaceae bacterium]MBP61932.1 6-phosphogluconolactonase [Planctomycetaceae bacterium]
MPSQDERLVFISACAPGDEGAICAYQLDVEGAQLKLVHRTTGVENPFFFAISSDDRYLYALHSEGSGGTEHDQVAAYQVVGNSGHLKLLNRQSALGSAACYVDIDKTGKMVVLSNYATGNVASYPVAEDGSLGESSSAIQHEGSSVDASRQEGPHAHCFVISPDNRFVYAADLGLDKVLGYRLDPATANLTSNLQAFVPTEPGAGPRHLTFHPNGKHMYVIHELKNAVTLFDYNADTGVLIERQTISTLPDDFDGTSHCADVKITPNGRFLYGTNRGHDSIAVYRLDESGRLTLSGIEASLGQGPQNLAIDPGGELLLCANMVGNNVVIFRIDPHTGGLTPAGEPVSLPSPSCIMFI